MHKITGPGGGVLLLALALLITPACRDNPDKTDSHASETATAETTRWYSETRPLYNKIPVTVRFAPATIAAEAAVWSYLESIDDVFNSYRPDSEVGRLNRTGASKTPRRVSPAMAEALEFSKALFEETGGAFDITVAPLVRLWGQAARSGFLPSTEMIAAARADVGLAAVSLDGNELVVVGRRAFDFGGVIKGMAADRAAAMLAAAGATSAFVQVGNETVAFGRQASGNLTRLAIEDPMGGETPLAMMVDPGTGLSATTSSNSKQPRIIDGVTYYHIVDPRTGSPVSTRTLSVTVAFSRPGQAGMADGLATAVAVLGPKAGLELVATVGGEALVVTANQDGTTSRQQSAGFAALLEPI